MAIDGKNMKYGTEMPTCADTDRNNIYRIFNVVKVSILFEFNIRVTIKIRNGGNLLEKIPA
jgi:hypothetical protein